MHLAVLIAASLGLGITVLLIPLALRWGGGAVLLGRSRDWHHTHIGPVPRLGGAVLAISFIAIEIYIALFHPELRAATPGRGIIVAASLAMFALGFWDDVRPLGAGWKLLGQGAIAATVCICGVGIEVWRMPFAAAPIQLGPWGPILTVVWLVSLTNLINLIDGIDGLAGGISLMLMFLIAAVAHQNGNFELLASGMAGALAGFLCYNFPPARIYLGDGGSYFLGFQIGLYSIVNSHKGTVFAALAAPLFVLVLPVTDACLTLARRGMRGLPLFRPDRNHLHHRLIATGGSRRRVVLLVYGLNLVFLLMGLAAFWSRGESVPILLGAAVLVLFVCAGSFRFSRRWFAIHRVVRSSLRMRSQVQYALSLARWLELESRRRAGPNELWPDLVFAAEKLGFASLKLTLQDEHRLWQRPDGADGGAQRRYDCMNGQYGSLEFTAPACPLHASGDARVLDCDTQCRSQLGGCLADPHVFETTSELVAEAWTRSAVQWNGHGVAVRFNHQNSHPKVPLKAHRVMQFMKRIIAIWLPVLAGIPLIAADPLGPGDIKRNLSRVPAAELPMMAAGLVKQAKARDCAATTTNVVKAAIGLNPAATALIVGAVVRAAPETAPLTARVAAVEQPAQLEEIARAAVAVAPRRAGEIVASLCSVAPAGYRSVALLAGRLAPQASRDVLRAVGETWPNLKPYIEREITAYGRTMPSVERCLDRAEMARTRANSTAVPGSTDGPPLEAGSPTGQFSPEAAGPKPPHGNGHPPGGRNYARP